MHTLTSTQKLSILGWRNKATQACLDCESVIKAMALEDNKPMKIKDAKTIVKWDIRFMRLKIQMSELQSLRLSSPLSFPLEYIECLDKAKEAITHGRKGIIGDKLHQAFSCLQRVSAKNELSKSFFLEGKSPSITDSEVNETVSDEFKNQLHNPELQKKQQIEFIKQLLKTHAIHIRESAHKTTALYKAQISCKRLGRRILRKDQEILEQLRSDIKSKYENIKNNHDALNVWLEIVKEAYALANKNTEKFLDKVNAAHEKREKLKQSLMKGFVALALTPFSLNNFADPAIQIANGVFSQLGKLAQSIADANAAQTNQNSLAGVARAQFFQFLSVLGHSVENEEEAIKKIDEMREKSPMEFVELMRRFSEYKLHGVAKEISQMYDSASKIWGNIKPEDIIRAQRMKIVRQEQSSLKDSEWVDIQQDKYNVFLEDTYDELKNQFLDLNKQLFAEINKQYPDKNDIIQIQKIIKLLSFDEKSIGINAVSSETRQALVKAMADKIEIHLVMKYACVYDPYFAGNDRQVTKHLELISKQTFDPYENSHFGLSPGFHSKAIIDHLISKIPEKKATIEPLRKVSFLDYLRCIWDLKTPPSQRARQATLKGLIDEYINCDLSTKLKEEVFKFAEEHSISLPKESGVKKTHEWKSEEVLREHAQKLTEPFIKEGSKHNALTERQLRLTKDVLNEQALVKSVPSTFDNKTVESIPDARSLLEI